jgi:branched-chain amino acid transport system substrate-binding protein
MVVASPSLEQKIVASVGEAAIGIEGTSHWNSDLDNPTNKAFVAAFTATYHRAPTVYAAQGYDDAKLIGAGLKGSGEKLDNAAFRSAMLKADVKLTRGAFAFNVNQHPIEDWYEIKAVKAADGSVTLRSAGKVLEHQADAYASACELK